MDRLNRLPSWIVPAGLFAVSAALLVVRLSAFGIWDPWELEAADAARRQVEGHGTRLAHAGPWLASLGFKLLGVHEWSGRLPVALCGLATAMVAYALGALLADRRVAAYSAAVAVTTPLLVLNSRLMLGEAPTFAVQGLIATGALVAISERHGAGVRSFGLFVALGACGVGVLARGALLAVLPPLLAVAGVAWIEARVRVRPFASLVLGATALALTSLVVRDVLADSAEYSAWLGGAARGGQPSSFDAIIERAFHAFAPWSAFLPLAIGRIVFATKPPEASASEGAKRDEIVLGQTLLLWLGLGYAAHTLFLSRYGTATAFLPIVAMACAVGLLLRDLERDPVSRWPLAIGGALLTLLLLRDYALYPVGPMQGLAVAELKAPDDFNPKAAWAAVLGTFAGVTALSLGAPAALPLDLRAPYRFARDSWRRGAGFKVWWLLAVLALAGLVAFGVIAWVAADAVKLTTQAAKWGKRLAFVPLLVPVGIAALQVALSLAGRLRAARPWLIVAAGIVVGAYTAHGFMPKLSARFSPRDVYETYNALAKPNEPLVEYRVGGRAAAYYARGTIVEVDSLSALVERLAKPGHTWAVVPHGELANIDRAYRRATRQHVFAADTRNGRVALISNGAVEGRKDENPLTKTVLREAPKPEHAIHARFEDKIELLGYDLTLPHKDHVGAGESFEVTWYFRALKAVPGDYKIFVHVDGDGQRIHGDHQPVAGMYPVRLWEEGDVIVDRHRMEVPNTYRPAQFTLFLGFYSGETRLNVVEGPKDDANRVSAGTVSIR